MGAKSSQSRGPGLNKSDGHLLEYFRKTFGAGGGGTNASSAPSGTGLTATGGVISDYTNGPAVYRAHIFASSGTFDVTAPGTFGDTVETFAIGGGGGGSGGFPGYGPGRGGGAGGAFVVTSYPVSVATYPISVGAGGAGAATGPASSPFATGRGTSGGNSTFTNPSPQVLTAAGGGGGGDYDAPSAVSPNSSGGPGGCGGGGGGYPGAPSDHIAGGTATQPSQNPGVANLTNYGFAGGTGDNTTFGGGGGGGGTGGVGDNYSSPTNTTRSGGPGIPNVYAYGPGTPVTYGAGGPTGGPNTGPTVDATYSTGNGGMGWLTNPDPSKGANGGSGIVVVRYQIAELTATAKASGGAVSFYNNKTIHTFTSSGSLVVPATISDVDYVVLAGGGGGNFYDSSYAGGAGGAGGYILKEGQTLPNATYPVQVGAGGQLAAQGGPSVFNSQTAAGGGLGGKSSPGPGGGGGSGGGSGGGGPVGVGQNYPGPTQQGYPGGQGSSGGGHAGGGGGFGGAGSNSGPPAGGGPGGVGVQLPADFRDPRQAPSDSSNPVPYQRGGGLGTPGPAGSYYVAGGGGGGTWNSSYGTKGGDGGAGGGGRGAFGSPPPGTPAGTPSLNGVENTGGGGGGSGRAQNGSLGGSGIVLIAYPT